MTLPKLLPLTLIFVGLAACGSAHLPSNHPIAAAAVANSTLQNDCPVMPSMSSAASTTQRAISPQATGTHIPAPTTFCLSAAEKAIGETVLHSPTLPDSAFLGANRSLTIATADAALATVSQQSAEQTALKMTHFPGEQVHSAILAELHDAYGRPAAGPLVWVVDITPPAGTTFLNEKVQYAYFLVNARSGQQLQTPELGLATGLQIVGTAVSS